MKKQPNKLIYEKSPYLLQHAYNPINWYPWGDEAFNKAKSEDKPIFLSIGYSTCHWCHVMEQESFNDLEVSKILNDHFISIKVDREERPDIDHIYMEFCQAINGNGGWPLTIIMTPNQKPFFAATYIPKKRRGRYVGLIELLFYIHNEWIHNKQEIINSADSITNTIKSHLEDSEPIGVLSENISHIAVKELVNQFDPLYGGFGTAPKFPTPHKLLFLLRYYILNNNKEALNMVEKTLIQMYKGGIFDHIGYGFSRYSTDEKWLIPHFEKMMYDNALLGITYLEAFLATSNKLYKDILEKLLLFSISEMYAPNQGFYTAIDADSEHEEGKYYLWSYNELLEILTSDEFNYLSKYYNVTMNGNFENKNIFNLLHHDTLLLEGETLKEIRNKLLIHRGKRVPPLKDDKILTSINGMMIALLSLSGRFLNDDKYIKVATDTAEFIINKLINEEGKLLSRYREGEAKYIGYLDDYAYFTYGLIELFLATSNERYLDYAIKLTDDLINNYYDKENGGFFLTSKDSDELIMRVKEFYDGAIPSGNSITTFNLYRLGLISDNYHYDEIAAKQFSVISSKIESTPSNYLHLISTYFIKTHSYNKIVLIYEDEKQNFFNIKELLHKKYQPFTEVIILKKDNIKNSKYFSYYVTNDEFTLHFCENNVCIEPLTNYEDIIDFLSN